MKFKAGDIIEIVRDDYTFKYRYKGTLGKIVDVRSYLRSHVPTHYLIKFTCYKIAHVYFVDEIDRTCELYKTKIKQK